MDLDETAAVDFGWILQMTFVVTVVAGVPLLALGSVFVSLPDWPSRAAYAGAGGGSLWLVTAVGLYLLELRRVNSDRGRDAR